MKKLLLSVILATSLAFSSCQFDDSDIWNKFGEMEESIRDHEQRISALEELCKQMNTNIEALQTLVSALEKRDYITNISEVRSNGEVIGYTISFAYSDTITIYHGKDGKNGTDGKDGYTPQIGVKQDIDGIYYWTLDGEWLLDAKGNKIQANGVNSTNGTNGVIPQLKIENDYWYVSYDNGATWEQLGKATGEDGKDGQDSFIIGVEESETEVVFILSNNTTITIPKHAKSSLADPDDICTAMDDVKFMEYCYQNFDVNKDGKVSPVEAKSVRSIDISDSKVYSIKGVEYFEILETFIAKNTTLLQNVDLSFNSKLISFSLYGCSSLTSVTIPNSVTSIGDYAFYSCTSLASITIPDSVTTIGDGAFRDCSSLTSVTIPDSVTSIGKNVFSGCTGELIVNCNIPSASSYDYGVFYDSDFTKVTICDSVTSIGDYAFRDCSSLTSVTIPDSVTTIGDYAFYNCTSLTSVYITDIAAWCNISFGYSYSNPLDYAGNLYLNNELVTDLIIPDSVTSIGNKAFYYCKSLTSVTIPDSVTTIGEAAFAGCDSLTSVTIPDSVTTIGDRAFYNCSSLTEFTGKFAEDNGRILVVDGVLTAFAPAGITEYNIPDSVTKIGNNAFYFCDSLTSVNIPDSVTKIGNKAFYFCESLTSVYCKPTTPPTGGNNMFSNNASGRKIYVPTASVNAYKAASYWSNYADSIVGYDF